MRGVRPTTQRTYSGGMRLRLLALALALSALAVPASAGGGGAWPSCFGAASRDPERPCENPELRLRVTPAPHRALLQGEGACEPVPGSTELCLFGVPWAEATATVALLGDSHAGQWRAALSPIADARRWQGFSLTRPSCPFSLSTPALPEPKRSQCMRFNWDVLAFMRDHPEITTVFVSQHRAKIIPPPGEDVDEARLRGYIQAWNALPETVERVVVIRDPNYQNLETLDCVVKAQRQRREPGRTCALRRRVSLKPDPAVIAARSQQQRDGLRVDSVDLSEFFCDRAWCYPVVGGVLVHKDEAHITQLYARTLSPYLLRAFDRLG